ncbi:MAG TPA: rhomboid family intramembrane serine protease [Polyangia bacterium]|nr:rhomboid family intramembrane serine protease [Polyangia bacterium]
MFNCPDCRVPLRLQKAGRLGVFWNCPRCEGRTATFGLLRRVADRATVGALWQAARAAGERGARPCPACDRRMHEVVVPGVPGDELVDVCRACHLVWFDPSEYERLPEQEHAQAPPPLADRLDEADRRELALCEIALQQGKAQDEEDCDPLPGTAREWAGGVLGLPVVNDDRADRGLPLATWVLAAAATVLSVISFVSEDGLIPALGLVPAEWLRYGGLTLLGSFFIHGGVLHLAVNLYCLLQCGHAVEVIEGRGRFLLLLVSATVAGGLAHVAVDPSSTIPCVGASGGLAGLFTFIVLEFPGTRISVFIRGRFFKLPLAVILVLWILAEMRDLSFQIEGLTDISAAAHLGGALAGFLWWLLRRAGTRD